MLTHQITEQLNMLFLYDRLMYSKIKAGVSFSIHCKSKTGACMVVDCN